MTYPSIPITISWLRQLHYYYFGLAKHLIWFPRIRYDKPLTIIGIFTNMAVFPTGTTWNHLEPVGSSWNLIGLGSSGTDWKFTSNWNPGGKFGGCSLLIWQVPYSENSSWNLPGSDWFQSEPVGHSKDLSLADQAEGTKS